MVRKVSIICVMKIIKGMEFIKICNFIERMFVSRKISFAISIEFFNRKYFFISNKLNFIQNLIRHNNLLI